MNISTGRPSARAKKKDLLGFQNGILDKKRFAIAFLSGRLSAHTKKQALDGPLLQTTTPTGDFQRRQRRKWGAAYIEDEHILVHLVCKSAFESTCHGKLHFDLRVEVMKGSVGPNHGCGCLSRAQDRYEGGQPVTAYPRDGLGGSRLPRAQHGALRTPKRRRVTSFDRNPRMLKSYRGACPAKLKHPPYVGLYGWREFGGMSTRLMLRA